MRQTFLTVVVLLMLIFAGNGEAGVVTDLLPFQCYVDHQVDTYNQPGGQRVGYISANVDLIQVTQVRGDGWAYGNYPGARGQRVARWFRITDICLDPGYPNRGANVQGAQRVFRTKDSGDTIGSVSNNEGVIVLADNGNRAQIIYRLDNGTGYKIGWVPSFCVSGGNVNHNPQGTVQAADSPSAGFLHVRGTAFDADNPGGSIRLHVYVGGGAGSGAPVYEIRTDGNRIFDDTRNVGRTGNQHVYIYALNDYGSGENVEIWNGYVNLQGNSEFAWPVPGNYRVTTTYTYSSGKVHSSRYYFNNRACGIDIAVPVGTEVRAVASGVVVNKVDKGAVSFGKWLEIRHDDGTCSVYAHLSDFSMVNQGQRVNKGDLIALSGNTGNSSGPHLHFELSGHDTYQYFKNIGVL